MTQETNESWIALGKLYSDQPLSGKSREELIKETKKIVSAYVWDKMRKYGETRSPFIDDPQTSGFIKAQRVEKIIDLNTEGYGYLLKEKEHFTIVVNKNLRGTKKRTVIAHELGHTFFFDENNKSIYSYPNNFVSCWPNIEGPAFEIGRQILVPEQSLPKATCSNVSLMLLDKLTRDYKVSKNIMAYRLIHDLQLWDAFIFFTKYDLDRDCILLPKNHERFKGRSFKNFNLNRNWGVISTVLKESIGKRGKIVQKKKKIGRYNYFIEGYYSKNKTHVVCLVKRVNN